MWIARTLVMVALWGIWPAQAQGQDLDDLAAIESLCHFSQPEGMAGLDGTRHTGQWSNLILALSRREYQRQRAEIAFQPIEVEVAARNLSLATLGEDALLVAFAKQAPLTIAGVSWQAEGAVYRLSCTKPMDEVLVIHGAELMVAELELSFAADSDPFCIEGEDGLSLRGSIASLRLRRVGEEASICELQRSSSHEHTDFDLAVTGLQGEGLSPAVAMTVAAELESLLLPCYVELIETEGPRQGALGVELRPREAGFAAEITLDALDSEWCSRCVLQRLERAELGLLVPELLSFNLIFSTEQGPNALHLAWGQAGFRSLMAGASVAAMSSNGPKMPAQSQN